MAEKPRGTARARMRLLPEYALVELYGDIDIASLSEVTAPLERATRESPRVVVDLRAVTFFDCTLLGLLCRTRTRVVTGRGHFQLVCDKPRALRILRLTDLLKVFAPVSSPAELTMAPVAAAATAAAGAPAAATFESPALRSVRPSEALLNKESCYGC